MSATPGTVSLSSSWPSALRRPAGGGGGPPRAGGVERRGPGAGRRPPPPPPRGDGLEVAQDRRVRERREGEALAPPLPVLVLLDPARVALGLPQRLLEVALEP